MRSDCVFRQLARVEEICRGIIGAANYKVPLTNNYLIKDWLSSEGLSMLFGESNVGKSVGCGAARHGRQTAARPPRAPTDVLYQRRPHGFGCSRFLSHLRSLVVTMSQKLSV